MSTPSRSIVVSASTGYSNLGDEAMLSETLRVLRTARVEEITVLSDDPPATHALHGVRAVPTFHRAFQLRYGSTWRRSFRVRLPLYLARLVRHASRLASDRRVPALGTIEEDVLDVIARGHAFLMVGGGGFNDLWRFHGIYARGAEILAAKRLRKPVFLGAQEIGPVWRPVSRRFLSYVFRDTYLTLRDFGVSQREVVSRLDLGDARVLEALDDAFDLPPTSAAACRALLGAAGVTLDPVPRQDIVAAVCVRGWWNRAGQGTSLRAALCETVTALADKDAVVLMLPMSLARDQVFDDTASAERVLELTGLLHHPRVHLVRAVASGADVKGILGLADVAVGSSYHFSLFALTMGTPAAGLYQDDYYRMKFEGLHQGFGDTAPAYDVRRARSVEVVSRLIALSTGPRAALRPDQALPGAPLLAARAAVAALPT